MTPEQEAAVAAARDAMRHDGAPSKVDAWRRDNECVVRHYRTASGGHVIQLGYMRCYSKWCDDCGELFIVRRSIWRYKSLTHTGRWPSYCPTCRAAHAQTHNKAAKDRMRRLRAKRRVWRDEMVRKTGARKPPARGMHARKQ